MTRANSPGDGLIAGQGSRDRARVTVTIHIYRRGSGQRGTADSAIRRENVNAPLVTRLCPLATIPGGTWSHRACLSQLDRVPSRYVSADCWLWRTFWRVQLKLVTDETLPLWTLSWPQRIFCSSALRWSEYVGLYDWIVISPTRGRTSSSIYCETITEQCILTVVISTGSCTVWWYGGHHSVFFTSRKD